MKPLVKTRTYSSPLRDEHAQRTRERILDALVEVLAQDPTELSVPAVADAAGVSVPTVYRHFGSKRGLMDGLYEHYSKQIGTDWDESEIVNTETFIERMPSIFRQHEESGTALRLAFASEAGNRLRRRQMPARLAQMERAIAGSGVKAAAREQMRDVFTILTSSVVQRAFKDYLGLDPEEAAERVAWAMRELVAANTQTKKGRKG